MSQPDRRERRRRNQRPRNRKERLAQRKAFDALALMRREGLTRNAAAKRVGTDPGTILRYVGTALERNGARGRYVAKPYDRIPRTIQHYVPGGSAWVTVTSSRTASMIADYRNALRRYGGEPDESILNPFRNKKFRAGGKTYEFITDATEIQRLLQSGVRGEGLYRAIQGSAT